MKQTKKILIFLIIFIGFFIINNQNVFAVKKVIFPTNNPPQPKPANIFPNISEDKNNNTNIPIEDIFNITKNNENTILNPDTENPGNYFQEPATNQTQNKNSNEPISLGIKIVIFSAIAIFLFVLYRKLKNIK